MFGSLHSTSLHMNPLVLCLLQSVVKEQQRRVSALETELKAKDSTHGTLQTKIEELQVPSCLLQLSLVHDNTPMLHSTCMYYLLLA